MDHQWLTIKPVRCSVRLEDADGHAFEITIACDTQRDIARQLRELADKIDPRDLRIRKLDVKEE